MTPMEIITDPPQVEPDSARSQTHTLAGLEPDNILSILSILGMLRALEVQSPAWGCRVRWNCESGPLLPMLQLDEPKTECEVAEGLAAGCQLLAVDYVFPSLGKDFEFPKLTAETAQQHLRTAIAAGPEQRPRLDLFASLFSESVVGPKGTVSPTPLCLLFGQGHQFFLERLSLAAHMQGLRLNGKRSQGRAPSAFMRRALFRQWERADVGPSLRWDTGHWDRQWFDRFSDPATDPVKTEAGAYTLAAFGLAMLTVCAVSVKHRRRLSCLCVREDGFELSVVWPIWTRWLSLQGLKALLSHPAVFQDPSDHRAWERLGVRETRWSRRFEVGKYRAFRRGIALHAAPPFGPPGEENQT